jgi:hypothetical protein
MLQSPICELSQHLETFGCGFIEMLANFNFFEDPRFDDSASCDHTCINVRMFDGVIKVSIRIDITVPRISRSRRRSYPRNAILCVSPFSRLCALESVALAISSFARLITAAHSAIYFQSAALEYLHH